jgi:hypothetical protein
MSEDQIIDNLDLMVQSIQLIQERFSKIREPDDFIEQCFLGSLDFGRRLYAPKAHKS